MLFVHSSSSAGLFVSAILPHPATRFCFAADCRYIHVLEFAGARLTLKAQKRWAAIGAAFPHEEGLGFSIELKAFPVDGRLVKQARWRTPQWRAIVFRSEHYFS